MAKWSFSVHGVTRIITSNIYTRLAACNCISITFWSGDLPSPLMAIFYRSKQCGPRTECSYRSSLIWVHTVFHRGFLNISADEKADDFCCDWRIKG